MKLIKAIKNFELNGIYYEINNEVKFTNISDLIRANELGFIEPQTTKMIQKYKKYLEEGEENGTSL